MQLLCQSMPRLDLLTISVKKMLICNKIWPNYWVSVFKSLIKKFICEFNLTGNSRS